MSRYTYISKMAVLGVVVLGGLNSCRVPDQYKTPEIDVHNLLGEAENADGVSIADVGWREYFTDPFLIDLIDEGIKQNFDMQIAHSRIRQAEVSLNVAKTAYFPDVALVAQVDQSRGSNGENGKKVLGYHTTDYVLGISAGWELDIWGKLKAQSRAKYAQFLNSHAYKNLIQTALIANIATSYYSLLALDEQRKITEETIRLMEENVETMNELKEAGLQNGAAVEQSKSLLYNILTSVPALKSQIRQMENAISVLVGRMPGTIDRSTFYEQMLPVKLKYGILAQALAKRPDVQQAELSFRSAFELTNTARANLYPSVRLSSGTIGYATHNTLSNFFKPEHVFAGIVGGLTQPIFAKKQLSGNLKIAQAQQQEALLAFEQSVLKAGKEVADILFLFESSLEKNEMREMQIEACRNSVCFTQELLGAGDANYTEVLTAEQNLLSALLNRVNDRLEQLQCTVNLYRALGGGIE